MLTARHPDVRYIDGKDILPPVPDYFDDTVHPNNAVRIYCGEMVAKKLSWLSLFNNKPGL